MPCPAVHPLTASALLSVLERARDADRADYRALTGVDMAPRHEAPFLCQASRIGAVFCDAQGVPQAAAGAIPADIPGIVTLWLHATDAWAAVWRCALRWIRREATAALWASGARRAQAFVMGDRPEAVRFLEACGLRREGLMARFAADGTAVRMMAGVA